MPTIFYWPAKLKPRTVNEPLAMVDVMPTVFALVWRRRAIPDHPSRQGYLADYSEGEPVPA